jgi:hypothetical protein
VGLLVWVGDEVGFADETGVALGVGVEEMAVKVAIMVALLQAMLVPTLSVLLALRLPPAMPIWEVPAPVTVKVSVAMTPEDSIEVASAVTASVNPPLIEPVVFQSCFEFPRKKVEAPAVLSAR